MSQTQIKICHVQLLPIMSGVQRSMLEILIRLDRSRYEATVLCKEEGDLTHLLDDLQIHWHSMPDFVRPLHPYRDMKAVIKLVRYFKRGQFQIVHTHSSKTGFIGRLAAYLAGVPVIIHTVQGFPFHEFSSWVSKKFYVFAERLAGRFSRRIIFVNNEERIMAVKSGILPAEKVVTIYNGVDLQQVELSSSSEKRSVFRKKWGLKPDDFVIGYVGRLWQQKDPETLMNVISACRSLDVRFLIVGDGPFRECFEKRFNGDDRVIMTGWIEHPMNMYPAIDVLLLPSLWEGLSMTLIEAMAFGKPLIASDIKGNRECVWPGENGYLCPPRQADKFAEAIASLAQDAARYKSMSLRSRELALQLFSAKVNAGAVIALYERELEAAEE